MRETRVNTGDTERTPARLLLRFLARHPRSVGTLAAVGITGCYVGFHTMLLGAGVAVAAGASWRLLDRPTFDRFAGRLVRAWWRRWFVYQRKWADIAFGCGLTSSNRHGHSLVPKLLSVRSTFCWDSLRLRLVRGQAAEDFEQVLDRLANAYNARRATLRTIKPGVISLDVQKREPFDTLFIPLPEMPREDSAVDLARLPLGRDEYGRDFALDLVGGIHYLIAGATGAGKGSWMWGLLRGLAPWIRSGRVRLWVLDPKGGMEFGQGAELFHRFATDDQSGLELTREYVDTLDERKTEMGRHGRRTWTPGHSADYPLDLLIVDELAAMSEYTDRDISREFTKLLSKALTQYRAVGGRVVAATQEPTKDVIPMRGLFPTTVALRLEEASYVDMALGEGVRDRGAFADQIPDYMPGVAYVKTEGSREPLRVRAAYTSDDDITELVRYATSHDAEILDFPNRDNGTETESADSPDTGGESGETDDIEHIEVIDDGEDEDDDEDFDAA
ncbi:DNA segregation ATPase FtsK/SpoIIIE, S-DNA-T family [Actinopolyspora xinjiangensis]|uniref:DNA segregation ATPase FtsK/SpoIIIE, S-DNA-T family n=1 Tax=Actinopolyspora xinjiangensis TaxID=405564 RepID=A0A1H0X1L2_9ACTN|nr:FtsK/SpoIIIE domain-containing protein [Actinopolyspora xinjiangensis]SDP96635.1 DNA segregation ATPase FtsK/SpoIIIE, S-DNA-T family [Actinopolyspora xinjiangensis]